MHIPASLLGNKSSVPNLENNPRQVRANPRILLKIATRDDQYVPGTGLQTSSHRRHDPRQAEYLSLYADIKKMIEDFELDKIVEEFYRKMEAQGAQGGGVKPEQKAVENKPVTNVNVVSKMENKQSAEKAKRSVEEAALARQPVKVE